MTISALSELSMMELFRLDAEGQIQSLTTSLLALENDSAAPAELEACMRAAHSLKGAARIVALDVGVRVAHALEDAFVAAQRGTVCFGQGHIDVLLQGVDLLNRIANTSEADIPQWAGPKSAEVEVYLQALELALRDGPKAAPPPAPSRPPEADEHDGAERVLRVTAQNLNTLLGLAGESLVESRWLKPFSQSLLRLKRLSEGVGQSLDGLRAVLATEGSGERREVALAEMQSGLHECQQLLAQRLVELEMFESCSTRLAHRLYDSALACRMRPFADGTRKFPRMVRDLGRALGKQARLDVVGAQTQVDRDVLEKLDAPLSHLLSNALDHGIESPEERRAAGKSTEGVIRLEARHCAGLLQITVSDDGCGMDLERLRAEIVERKLANATIAKRLSDSEVLEFLFLPGFTTKRSVTEISGRGVGLDVVQNMIRQVRGSIRVFSEAGKGARFQLQLPLTLSVVRTLLVQIGGEPYAFPLAHILRTLKVPRNRVERLEGRDHFTFHGRLVGLVNARQLFGGTAPADGDELSVIVLGDPANCYGLVMDRFLGERELVVQPLDNRLGKIRDIAAGAVMEDGSPVLIVDCEDLLHSLEKLATDGGLHAIDRGCVQARTSTRKRVLVVDDSLTVREMQRKLLDHAGYEVATAVDGMDGWNAARAGQFDLIVTDVDMPRVDGIELVTMIKNDPNLQATLVMIVSYKDREADRQRGLDAGADHYLTKGSFQDDTLLRAVLDLIGGPTR